MAGLRRFLTDGGFGAFTTNFQDLGALRQLPGLAVQRLMADGYGFGGEGDWKTSMLLATLKAAAYGRTGGTSFLTPVRSAFFIFKGLVVLLVGQFKPRHPETER